ncbi:protein of unknown function [Aminobacter niigataensis]|nr:protein of unknown function [Aminobacter niigataensis]CAI2933039.1 protein of unknown function [Aminobacter niigataensis]
MRSILVCSAYTGTDSDGMQSRAKVRVRPFPLSGPKQPEPFKAARALVRRIFAFHADRWHGRTGI